jgi:DMSO/TMAO reductase YedYZ heme-binding membrane subunit
MPAQKLASAIRAVHGGCSQMAPGVIEKLANQFSADIPIKAELSAKKVSQAPSSKPKDQTKKTKVQGEKPLFRYGDWISLTMGIVMLSQLKIPGMGHHLGHAALIFLMFALIARPIRFFWDFPLRHRRTIGILAFALSLAHVICATQTHLESNFATIFSMSLYHQLGMWAGVVSLIAMTPAAITSFQYLQRKLGKRWKQIHLLTVPSLILALLHTLLIGPDYMRDFRIQGLELLRINIQGVDLVRAIVIGLVTLLVLLTRKRFFWSLLGLNKAKTPKQNDIS